jgi:hypothetical protein
MSSAGSDSSDPWEVAKARFLDGLNENEKTAFHDATLENLYYVASNMNRADQNESKTRAGLENLQPLVSAIQDYGKALDTFTNAASLYLAPIWGSIRVLLAMAISHSHFYSRMVDTFGRIGDILPRFSKDTFEHTTVLELTCLGDYQRIFDRHKHHRFSETLSAVYLDIIILCTEFKMLLQGLKKSTMRRFFQPLSPALSDKLEEAVARFRKHRKEVDKEAEVCHMIEEKEARDLVLRNQEAAEARVRGRHYHITKPANSV